MAVKINLHPNIRAQIRSGRELYAEGKIMGDCIDEIESKYPGIKEKLVGEDGKLRKGYKIFINDLNAYPDELNRELHDGDVVTIITYITGG
jgi:molybdopterin synthase sulfur carrier subunit